MASSSFLVPLSPTVEMSKVLSLFCSVTCGSVKLYGLSSLYQVLPSGHSRATVSFLGASTNVVVSKFRTKNSN